MSRKRQNDASFPTGKQLSLENTQNIFVSIMTRPNMLPIRRCILRYVDVASGWSLSCAFPHFNADFQVEADELLMLHDVIPNYMYYVHGKDKETRVQWHDIRNASLHWSLNTPTVGSLLSYVWNAMPRRIERETLTFRGMLWCGANSAVLQKVWTTFLSPSFKSIITPHILDGRFDLFIGALSRRGAAPGSILDIVQFTWKYIFKPNLRRPYMCPYVVVGLFRFCIATRDDEQTFQAIQWLRANVHGLDKHVEIPSYSCIHRDAISAQNISLMKQLWTNDNTLELPGSISQDADYHWTPFIESVCENSFMLSCSEIQVMIEYMFTVHGLPCFETFWKLYPHIFMFFDDEPVPETILQYMDTKYLEKCTFMAERDPADWDFSNRYAFLRSLKISFRSPVEMTHFYTHLQRMYPTEIAKYVTADAFYDSEDNFHAEADTLLRQWRLLHLLH